MDSVQIQATTFLDITRDRVRLEKFTALIRIENLAAHISMGVDFWFFAIFPRQIERR